MLQGIVQEQEQRHGLITMEKENIKFQELRANLIISGLDEVDSETETSTTEISLHRL